MEEREIVDEVVRRVIKELQRNVDEKEIDREKLVITANQDVIKSEILEEIKLLKNKFQIEYLDELEDTTLAVDRVLIPNLSQNLLVKVVQGFRDSKVTDLIAINLLREVPIYVIEEGVEVLNYSEHYNSAYVDHIKENLSIIKNFGAMIAPLDEIMIELKKEQEVDKDKTEIENNSSNEERKIIDEDTVETKKAKEALQVTDQVISKNTIENAKTKKVKELIVNQGAIITPLAKDLAKQEQIQFTYS